MYLYVKEKETHQLINLVKFETISKKRIGEDKFTLALYKENDKNGAPSVTAGYYSVKEIDGVLADIAECIATGKRLYSLDWFNKKRASQ